jgi:glycosyltransferase involved in cell wall biosynthesis
MSAKGANPYRTGVQEHTKVRPDLVVLPTTVADPGNLRLSIVMPAHNEERLIARAVQRVLAVSLPVPAELIVVDDGSTDRTFEVLQSMDHPDLSVHRHPVNLGKGTAVITGAAVATGTHLLVFDADLEYDPRDIPKLLEPVISGRATVVYGNRMFGMNTVYPSFRYALGNRVTTFAANVMFDSCVSDLHTCQKLIPLAEFRGLRLTESGFGLDTELTAELLRRGVRPYEVAVSYFGRSRSEGKKITWRDGVKCLSVLGRVRMRRTPAHERRGSGQPNHTRPPDVLHVTGADNIVDLT